MVDHTTRSLKQLTVCENKCTLISLLIVYSLSAFAISIQMTRMAIMTSLDLAVLSGVYGILVALGILLLTLFGTLMVVMRLSRRRFDVPSTGLQSSSRARPRASAGHALCILSNGALWSSQVLETGPTARRYKMPHLWQHQMSALLYIPHSRARGA
jgi:hypothetical protein